MTSRFGWAYMLAGFFAVCMFTIGAHAMLVKVSREPIYKYKKITNSSYPDELQAHFGPYGREFQASLLGLPQDGICDEWTNKVSWRIIVCWGTQPEAQP